jgi:hypothetical protein
MTWPQQRSAFYIVRLHKLPALRGWNRDTLREGVRFNRPFVGSIAPFSAIAQGVSVMLDSVTYWAIDGSQRNDNRLAAGCPSGAARQGRWLE